MMTQNNGNFNKNFHKGTNSRNKPYKVKKFKKFSPQAGGCTSLEPKIEGFKGKCNFCHAFGHKKANCNKFTAWLEKKGTPFMLVCFESNMVDVPFNTWWLDTCANSCYKFLAGITKLQKAE